MTDPPALLPSSGLADAASRVQDYLRNTRAENTRKAYASDWQQFSAWCQAHGQYLHGSPATMATATTSLASTGPLFLFNERPALRPLWTWGTINRSPLAGSESLDVGQKGSNIASPAEQQWVSAFGTPQQIAVPLPHRP